MRNRAADCPPAETQVTLRARNDSPNDHTEPRPINVLTFATADLNMALYDMS